jgi:precorrin-6y C5,15-methyltransferase (decarboxylating) CbiE subunit
VAKPKAFIIGVGPGSPDWLSPAALLAIQQSDWIIGWEMDFKPLGLATKGKRMIFQTCENYLNVMINTASEALSSRATLAVLKTGDPLVAPAGLEELKRIFNAFDLKIIPGISTVQLAAARVPISLCDCQIFTYHPLPHDGGCDLRLKRKRMLSALERNLHLLVLTGVRQMPKQTASFLIQAGINAKTSCVVCQDLSQSGERIVRCSLEEVARSDFGWQSVLAVINQSPGLIASGNNL